MLSIHLEETDCFSAWVSAKEVGMGRQDDGSDPKCKYNVSYLTLMLLVANLASAK